MSLFRRTKNKLSRSKLQEEIDAEMASHIEMRIADSIAAGMSPEAARRDALIRFGNRTSTRERVTEADAGMLWDSLFRDLHYAARQLRRTPAFTITALVTLILAIGANVVVFSILNAFVLRPLDVPQTAANLQRCPPAEPATTTSPTPTTSISKTETKRSATWRSTGSNPPV